MVHVIGGGVAVLGMITLVAATVNGALGYGFSSLTVPVALLYLANRVLNPAMVLVEVGMNSYVLFVNRAGLRRTFARVLPIALGIVPGVAAGSYLVYRVSPAWMKLGTYLLLLPIILLQAAGFRRRIKAEKSVSVPLGVVTGLLYSLTTISGPPLAALLNNQGYPKEDFRAAMGLARTVESLFTAVAYYYLGLYSARSLQLSAAIVPSLLIGIPFGAWLIRRMEAETFRRLCMSFDAWAVAFGLSKIVDQLQLLPGPRSYCVLVAVAVADLLMLASFFAKRAGAVAQLEPGL